VADTAALMRDPYDLLTGIDGRLPRRTSGGRGQVGRKEGGRSSHRSMRIIIFLFCSHSLILCRLTWSSSSSPVLSMESALAVVHGQSWSDLHRQAILIVFRSCDDVSVGRDHKSLPCRQSSHSVKHTIREEDLRGEIGEPILGLE
jgi:hypothetical protein